MNLSFPVDSALHPRNRRSVQAGFGLLQVMLVLLLVGAALAAGAVLLQAKRAPQQAITQEQTLRWADEAIAAFASTHARLPCPAQTLDGEEALDSTGNCIPGNAKGWLPTRTLLGASGNGMPVGPVAYMVYRGDAAAHLDLTAPGNAYQPPLIDGTNREIISLDKDRKETGRRPFSAINGLDLCRSLELAQVAGTNHADTTRAGVHGVPWNVAYGIAAAGPLAGQSRLDDDNTGTVAQMESPWREWDSGYDDRVRVRSFDAAAQMLGCRLLAELSSATAIAGASTAPFSVAQLSATPGGNEPYNVSLAGMDVLAAAVTLHDALALLQQNNIDATESAVQSAAKAQISLIFKLVTTAVSLSDQITTLVTSTVSLTRSIATCIASLGTMCWEVPLKTAAVVTSIVGLGTKGVTLAAKAASLPFVALALDATVKARDLARKGQSGKIPQNLDEARAELECTLYARNCDESTSKEVVYKRDDNGNPIQKKDPAGNLLYDEHGNPVFEVESETVVPRIGLDKQTENAKKEWDLLQYQVDMLERYRLAPWGVAAQEAKDSNNQPVLDINGLPTYKLVEIPSLGEDGQYRSQVQQRIHPQRTCGIGVNSTDWQACNPQRYRKQVDEWVCKPAGGNGGLYDANCNHVGTRIEKDSDGNDVTVNAGTHDRVLESHYEFNWDVATNEAIALRKKAEEWVDLNKREQELKKEIKQFEDNIDTWFKGGDSILAKMLKQMDDAQHCGGRGRGNPADPNANLPSGDMQRQQCINARSAVRYIETCEKPVTVAKCEFIGNGKGRYSDSSCKISSGTPKNYGWQETNTGVYERDKNELATCKPNMEGRLAKLQAEHDGLAASRDAAKSAYNSLPKPWLAYPGPTSASLLPYSADSGYNWFEWAIEITKDANDVPTKYDWVRSSFIERYLVDEDCSYWENQKIWVAEDTSTSPVTPGYWRDNWVKISKTCKVEKTRSLPWYAPENYKDLGATAPLLVTERGTRTFLDNRDLEINEIMSEKVCEYFTGRRWRSSGWWWPGDNTLNGWDKDTQKFGVYCQRYPYSRAFEDWRRAKLGAENARKNYQDTKAQFEKLKEELENMNDDGGSGGGPTTQMSFGAEATLEHADSRGSTGPQAPVLP
ncbi:MULTISPECIES: hypothetical protein [Stenotrophomonas]|uniref:Type IV secretion protein Rhs n=1 Tax=Stenotrophomonas nitritireducens TaxID=83617 RepID=A0ABR5NKS7_9GAMM|nr:MULTISPECIES: hypothetical protein [Stenotrophomonas]KQN96630.1 hypothetical protein ASF01_14865 [Stenotrophomonas sp. Leaf70]KRG58422.1 hypothetical protein ABB22_07535 [Stenotrophomonas nitritireducens]